MALGNKIQSLREEHNLSQKELAGLVGVSTGVIAEWEADEATPTLVELSRLSKALGVSSDVLLDATTEVSVTPIAQVIEQPIPAINTPKKHKKISLILGLFIAGILTVAAILLLSGLLGNRTS